MASHSTSSTTVPRKRSKTQSEVAVNPFFCFPKRGTSFELLDPLPWKSYTLNLPELADSTLCYSRDGWLLMRRSVSIDMFFFNPFSRELVSLPKF
ncbi:hypothetical protein DY000_02011912 [Brassica cretica]|uniref:KIB1-4 beta-propeller domain-containing protein n=1 Tax=Brassica cretica TaxID=69181 RepID=A0ABQ7CYH4_BRACR|nr:hypothetical protein DY000_02011912 [Brassica cretica]